MHSIHMWTALERTKGIGPANLMDLYSILEKNSLYIQDIMNCSEEELKDEFSFSETILKSIREASDLINKTEEEIMHCIEAGIDIICFFDNDYPAEIKKHLGRGIPPFLYCYGNRKILEKPGVAVLGDKFITERGEAITIQSVRELSRHNICVISGYAQGADIAAHRASLLYGGSTIAFLPHGILNLKTSSLLQDVMDMERMLFVSQFYPYEPVNQFNAFNRNRLACAQSRAVYIVEAPEQGGIFEAAKSAHKLGVPLFTTEYAQYPENAEGNKKIIQELKGKPVRAKKLQDSTIPNIDYILAAVRYGE